MNFLSNLWRHRVSVGATLIASFYFSIGQAEDIDLFVGASSGSVDKPNVLIVLDNTANWNTPFAAEKAALVTLVNSLDERFNVGLMMFTEPGGGHTVQGGYVRFAIRNMTAANKTALAALVNGLEKSGSNSDAGSNGHLGVLLNEAYLYFKAGAANSGIQPKRDYLNNTAGGISASVAASGNAFISSDSTTYVTPVTSACSNNYIIYISNGHQGDNDVSDATTLLTGVGGNTTKISLDPDGSDTNMGDEWARFLASADVSEGLAGTQSVRTFTIDVPEDNGQTAGWTALLKSMATHGQGEYFVATNTNQIAGHLKTIFSDIQAVNSSFASASLPVNVNTQGTYLNQIFIGMFRPDAAAKPRWMGNLKQYQFVATYDSTSNSYVLEMGDKDGVSAISSSTGFIRPCAASFWTTNTLGAYWPSVYPDTSTPFGSCIDPPNPVTYDLPDGEVVEKGGAGQHLRMLASIAERTVHTCALASCPDLLLFTTENTGLSADLVNWTKGQDVDDEDGDSNTTEIRRSVHGDVVHARPLAIDFGTGVDANGKHIPDVKVFYGANDGMLRAINADSGDPTNPDDPEGSELWSFVAPERWTMLDRIKTNTGLISFPTFTGTPKDYFFDGPIGHYTSGTTTWIFPTMRRGGRTLYAFNVSNPALPTLMWRRGCTDNLSPLGSPAPVDTSCSSGWDAIGQTWSEPKATLVAGYVDGSSPPQSKPILIMGGGYDTCEDVDPAICATTKGNRVFVIDAQTGNILKALTTDRAVPADVTLVDVDGTAELAYAVDTGGNIYRIVLAYDAAAAADLKWANTTITKIASLGCDTADASCTKSKFLFAPETVVVGAGYNSQNGYTAVLVGSGDREHPLDPNTSNGNNAFFMIQDNINNSLIDRNSLAEVDNADVSAPTVLTNKKGWFLDFDVSKEATVTSSVVVGGFVYFSTYAPTASAQCGANLGSARGYAVNFLDATAHANETRFDTFTGGGLPPSPVAGIVEVNVTITNADGTTTTSTKNVPFIIGGKMQGEGNVTDSPLQGHLPTIPISVKRSRVYWYLEK